MELVREIEDCKKGGSSESEPVTRIEVVDCGEIDGEVDPNDPYPSNPQRYEGEEKFEDIAAKIRTRGNDFYKEKKFRSALRKYKKAIK